MKVEYLGATNELRFINGRTYDVIGREEDLYRIIDEMGEDYLYSLKNFEIADGRRIMIGLTEPTDQLADIEGFDWDPEFEIDFSNNNTKYNVLSYGVLTKKAAEETIRSLPEFVEIYDDTPIGPAGIGPTGVSLSSFLTGKVVETSERAEFELLLLFAKNEGKDTTFYQKWINKMMGGKHLAKPVFEKMIREFGDEYDFWEKTDEVMEIYIKVKDKSRIKEG